jgi:hypothetical protein
MSAFGGSIGAANFQEPSNPDQTSAPAMQIPQGPQQQAPLTPRAQAIAGGLAQALAKRKKAGSISPTSRVPAQLAAAISRAKRARQGGDKYGS